MILFLVLVSYGYAYAISVIRRRVLLWNISTFIYYVPKWWSKENRVRKVAVRELTSDFLDMPVILPGGTDVQESVIDAVRPLLLSQKHRPPPGRPRPDTVHGPAAERVPVLPAKTTRIRLNPAGPVLVHRDTGKSPVRRREIRLNPTSPVLVHGPAKIVQVRPAPTKNPAKSGWPGARSSRHSACRSSTRTA